MILERFKYLFNEYLNIDIAEGIRTLKKRNYLMGNRICNIKYKRQLLILFLLSILILASSSVYAQISIHPNDCSYGDTSCGALVRECPIDDFGETELDCPVECTMRDRPCEYEKIYLATFWIHGDYASAYAYTVDYDDSEEFCTEVSCGASEWNADADNGDGECCGDDSGAIAAEWAVIVTIDEEDIPEIHKTPTSKKVNFHYESTAIQQESVDFEVPETQQVSWRFILKGCYLYNTELYAKITNSAGATVAEEDGAYIFQIDADEQCTGHYVYTGTFTAEPEETYTLEIYKGMTDVESDEGLGFEDMSLEVTYKNHTIVYRNDTLRFVEKISSNTTLTFHLRNKSNGILNKDSIERYMFPASSAYIGETLTTLMEIDEYIADQVQVFVITSDSGSDCGMLGLGDICFDTYKHEDAGPQGSGETHWQWMEAEGAQGGIIDLECLGKSAVSDGKNWHVCKYPNNLFHDEIVSEPTTSPQNNLIDFTETRLNIADHHFLCYDDGLRARIAECTGEESPHSSISATYSPGDGTKLETGESIQTGGVTYYCTTYSELQIDLDNIDNEDRDSSGKSCTEAKYPTGEPLTWTGSLCCGEADDGEEYYNDLEGNGGCWKSQTIRKGTYVTEDGAEIEEVINYNGEFLGCAIAANAGYSGKGYLLELKDKHTDDQLITDKERCTIVTNALGDNAYCSYWGEWHKTPETNLSASISPISGSSSCCPVNQCWDGNSCTANQINDNSLDTFYGYRCYDGEWVEVELKEAWDKEEVGFCPRADQCLVTMAGSSDSNDDPDKFYTMANKPICVADGDYFLDKYCENGKWTSRTKQIASAMINMATEKSIKKYTLYCDDYNMTLPEYKNILPENCNRVGYQVPCINNVCILSYEDKVIIGTSYNVPIDSDNLVSDPIAKLCKDAKVSENATPSGKFVSCDSRKVWYNHDIESIIFNKDSLVDVSLLNNNWLNFFSPLFKGVMDAMLDLIIGWGPKTMLHGEVSAIPVDFINNMQDFDKIYITHAGGKHIIATYGKAIDYTIYSDSANTRPTNFIALTYEGFEITDICQYVEKYKEIYQTNPGETVACNKTGNNYYIFSRYEIGEDIWQDLTSKLRIDASTTETCSNECTALGAKQCGTGLEYKACGLYDYDSCMEWSPYFSLECKDYCENSIGYHSGHCSSGDCAYSEEQCEFGCFDDACKICEDTCPYYGAKKCTDDTHYQICLDYNNDGCLEFGEPIEISCPDYCAGSDCYKQGSCSLGECSYAQTISCGCDNICNDADCDFDPDCSCINDDGCCGVGCAGYSTELNEFTVDVFGIESGFYCPGGSEDYQCPWVSSYSDPDENWFGDNSPISRFCKEDNDNIWLRFAAGYNDINDYETNWKASNMFTIACTDGIDDLCSITIDVSLTKDCDDSASACPYAGSWNSYNPSNFPINLDNTDIHSFYARVCKSYDCENFMCDDWYEFCLNERNNPEIVYNGINDDECSGGNTDNDCICIPDCLGKQCGDDLCGGTCGACASKYYGCNDQGQCEFIYDECYVLCDSESDVQCAADEDRVINVGTGDGCNPDITSTNNPFEERINLDVDTYFELMFKITSSQKGDTTDYYESLEIVGVTDEVTITDWDSQVKCSQYNKYYYYDEEYDDYIYDYESENYLSSCALCCK